MTLSSGKGVDQVFLVFKAGKMFFCEIILFKEMLETHFDLYLQL